jgi:hypothetical protein
LVSTAGATMIWNVQSLVSGTIFTSLILSISMGSDPETPQQREKKRQKQNSSQELSE